MATPTMPPALRSAVRQRHATADEHCQRYEALREQRATFESDWQDIVRYLVPGADDVLEQHGAGQSRTETIFDSHPLLAPKSLASHLDSGATNSAWQWFGLTFRDEELQQSQAVNQWLEDCSHRMSAAYAASTFYQAAYTFYLHLGAFGTAAMWVGTRLRSEGRYLHFKTLPTGSYCIAENADGLVDTLYHERYWTPRQANELFEGQISDALKGMLDKPGAKDTPKCFLHCAYPREGRNPEQYDNLNMPYAGVILEKDTKFINEETGYQEFPFVVSRWETMSKSPYGFGPGHVALPDVRMLNTLRELHLQQLTLWVQPPLMALSEGILGHISLEPRAVNVVRQMDALQPMNLTGRPDLVQIDQEYLRRSIDDCFYVNALQALPPPGASNMTAYEVSQRIELMRRLMGPAFSRLLAEFLDPLADRVFGLMLRERALPAAPREVLEVAARMGGQIDVEYEGPLARSQRQADAQAFEQAIAVAMRLVEMKQSLDILDNIDWDSGFREAARIYGVPKSHIIDMAQVSKMRQARSAQAQQLQQAEQMRENVTAISRTAPLVQAVQGQGQRIAA